MTIDTHVPTFIFLHNTHNTYKHSVWRTLAAPLLFLWLGQPVYAHDRASHQTPGEVLYTSPWHYAAWSTTAAAQARHCQWRRLPPPTSQFDIMGGRSPLCSL